jgi:hypothetical protein
VTERAEVDQLDRDRAVVPDTAGACRGSVIVVTRATSSPFPSPSRSGTSYSTTRACRAWPGSRSSPQRGRLNQLCVRVSPLPDPGTGRAGKHPVLVPVRTMINFG